MPMEATLFDSWEWRYNKKSFYYGLRVLLELVRKGKTRLTKAPRI